MSKLIFTASTLPVSKKLHKLLSEQLTAHLLSNEALTTSRYLVFNFRDKSYRAEEGGFHPVEMAICQTSTGEWSIEYITDFAYMGNYYPELERNLDFDFRVGQFFVAYRGWLPMQGDRDAKELYQLWENNFLTYVDMDSYNEIAVTPQ
ncbi:DUF2787 domain-containing protein [Vibrio parahaemolyticus]|uniref:DUF2787 domain-containing protein n=1 Tax=Vibrio parahaemolyticus TaxID=670 RepID=UPI0004D53880|nr:DUF2787 domain-containing protein [Vibrio parahaemolyticus]EGQ8043604.1 DUF2787 domain-containing protein [Vibrio parahaemolyticus]EGQ9860861.1 DUF2787 domain-containing protein [Vibrio parahaemolyticus]EHH2864099.1 DUF2787 domain-containing protein [Vibrio parahaemolyticus]EJG1624620.1 DUF2787 domain-containing protein [Vibrio parahaemolyticus]EKB7898558.1 DUF2787 domain-containing protein [Vibrio parahaemolyticus]